jgi:predicted DNA-binding transcriptional regulator
MNILKSKDLRKGDLKAVETRIMKYVKKNQPVYMGEIIKDMRMSQFGGQKRIMDLLQEGYLKYKKGSAKIVR